MPGGRAGRHRWRRADATRSRQHQAELRRRDVAVTVRSRRWAGRADQRSTSSPHPSRPRCRVRDRHARRFAEHVAKHFDAAYQRAERASCAWRMLGSPDAGDFDGTSRLVPRPGIGIAVRGRRPENVRLANGNVPSSRQPSARTRMTRDLAIHIGVTRARAHVRSGLRRQLSLEWNSSSAPLRLGLSRSARDRAHSRAFGIPRGRRPQPGTHGRR